MIVRDRPIFAAAVERILTAHPAVRDAAVIEIPDAKLGQRMARFVQLERGLRCSVVHELLTSAATLLGDGNVPESLEVVDEIPRINSARSPTASTARPDATQSPRISQAARVSKRAGPVQ